MYEIFILNAWIIGFRNYNDDTSIVLRYRVTLSLRILNVSRGDFGNYTCEAQNKYGRSERTMILSGMRKLSP